MGLGIEGIIFLCRCRIGYHLQSLRFKLRIQIRDVAMLPSLR